MFCKVDFSRLALLSSIVAIGVVAASAQSYYDDDIYYDASKAKKETPKTTVKKQPATQPVQQTTQLYYDGAQYVPWSNVGDYQSADSYQSTGSSTRDVDEYNRRYTSTESSPTDSISLQQYIAMSNTQKLARFQDSDVAARAVAADESAYDYDSYYQQPSNTTINLNIVGGYPYYGYYGSPWYWNSWTYDPFWYGSYYRPYWGWSWGPSWAWGPSWSWSWGWGWGGPHWGGPHWGGHWGGHWAYRPQSSYGAYRPNTTRTTSGAIGSGRYTTGGSNYRNGVSSSRNTTNSASASRPGYRQPLGTPSVSGTSNGSYGTRGRSGSTAPSSTSSGRYTAPSNSHTNSSNGTYRNNSSNSSSGSFGSSRGGFSGGGHSGASGGSGGRRGR